MKNIKTNKNTLQILRGLALLVVFIVLGLPVYGDSESDKKKFEDGKPVIWIERDGNRRKVEGKILINANIDECWKVLADVEALADWAPGVTYSRAVGKVGDRIITMCGGKIFFLTVHIPESLLLDEENKILVGEQLSDEEVAQYKKMGWDLTEGNYTKYLKEEHWLEAYGDKTVWYYTVTIELKHAGPKMLENFYCKVTVPAILKAAKKGVEAQSKYYSQQDKQTP